MKRLFLLGSALLLFISITGCKNNNKIESTDVSVTETPADFVSTDSTIETKQPSETDVPAKETKIPETQISETQEPTEATEIPLDFQKEGWISADESITLLKMYLGSYDDTGNEFVFGHESTIYQDGKYYYNFRITTLIVSDTGLAHQSYYGNYLVSTDGIDIIECTNE